MIVTRYIFKRIVPFFVVSTLFFVFILQLVDLLMNLWNYISNNVSIVDILKIYIFYIPKCVSFSIPLALLFSVVYVLSDMYSKNELTICFASGIPLMRIALPVLLFSLVLSVLSFFLDDRIVVPTYNRKTELQNTLLNKNTSFNNSGIVVQTEKGKTVYKADFYNDDEKKLLNLYVVMRNDEGSLDKVIRAESACWEEDHWELSNAVCYSVNDDKTLSFDSCSDVILDEPFDTFRRIDVSVETISSDEAKKYISYRKRVGLPYSEALAQYYKKFSFPLVTFIVTFLSISLSGKSRKNVFLISLISSIVMAAGYYVSQMVTMVLSKYGYISPFMGAWLPVILFTILSFILLKYSRT